METHHEDRTYAGLLAVARDSLDLIGERLDFQPRGEQIDRLDEVRTDLLRWKDSWRHFVSRADLPETYRRQLQVRMGRAARELDSDLNQPAPVLRVYIDRARNSLFDESACRSN